MSASFNHNIKGACSDQTAGDQFIRWTKAKFGNHNFSIVGRHVWNNLPSAVQQSSELETFKRRLMQYLFWVSYAN